MPNPPLPLDIEVKTALEARRGDWKQIAEESGISYSWISQFVREKIPNPGFATLRDLRAYLIDGIKPAPTAHPSPTDTPEPAEAGAGS